MVPSLVCCLLFNFLLLFVLSDRLRVSGQPRRHLLQSGWSVFVSSKRLVAGDAFIFLRSRSLSCSSDICCVYYSYSHLKLESFEFPGVRMESFELE